MSVGIIFVALFIFSTVVSIGAFLFGHFGDHEVAGGHDVGHDGGGMPSIFSTRIISLFLVGFSGMGALSTYVWDFGAAAASFIGVGSGIVMGAVAYVLMAFFSKSAGSSLPESDDYAGLTGRICTAIPAGGTGEVAVTVRSQYRTLFATSADGSAIPDGRPVKLVSASGGTAVVKPISE